MKPNCIKRIKQYNGRLVSTSAPIFYQKEYGVGEVTIPNPGTKLFVYSIDLLDMVRRISKDGDFYLAYATNLEPFYCNENFAHLASPNSVECFWPTYRNCEHEWLDEEFMLCDSVMLLERIN